MKPNTLTEVKPGALVSRNGQLYCAETQIAAKTATTPPCADCQRRIIQQNNVRWYRQAGGARFPLCDSCAGALGLGTVPAK